MYSYEDRIRAVDLYIELGKRVKATLRRDFTVHRSTRWRSGRLLWIIFSTMDAASISPGKR